QDLLDALDRGALAPLDVQDVHPQADALRQIDPQVAELAEARRQDAGAGGERVRERRLPAAGVGAREDKHLSGRGFEDLLQILEQGKRKLRKGGRAVILHRAVHGAQNALGDVRGTGNEEEVATGYPRHRGVLRMGRKTKREPAALAEVTPAPPFSTPCAGPTTTRSGRGTPRSGERPVRGR